jgi:hypothetical protein
MKLEFSRQSFEKKKTQVPSSIKTCPVGAELFHADRQTDTQTDRQTDRQTGRQTGKHDEANSRISQFCERA